MLWAISQTTEHELQWHWQCLITASQQGTADGHLAPGWKTHGSSWRWLLEVWRLEKVHLESLPWFSCHWDCSNCWWSARLFWNFFWFIFVHLVVFLLCPLSKHMLWLHFFFFFALIAFSNFSYVIYGDLLSEISVLLKGKSQCLFFPSKAILNVVL